ncbi:MAG: DUF3253 domain-containing protein [Proteobacteria bacterium]|nr:MAG: DUF3253 domain-containing protein [Pseudomonadota bacterium]
MQLLAKRGPEKTICPSEVLPAEEKKNKLKMDTVREAAKVLIADNKIEATQKGKAIDLDTVKGPIRLRLKVQTPTG